MERVLCGPKQTFLKIFFTPKADALVKNVHIPNMAGMCQKKDPQKRFAIAVDMDEVKFFPHASPRPHDITIFYNWPFQKKRVRHFPIILTQLSHISSITCYNTERKKTKSGNKKNTFFLTFSFITQLFLLLKVLIVIVVRFRLLNILIEVSNVVRF